MHAGRAQAVPWARGPTFAHAAHMRVPLCADAGLASRSNADALQKALWAQHP